MTNNDSFKVGDRVIWCGKLTPQEFFELASIIALTSAYVTVKWTVKAIIPVSSDEHRDITEDPRTIVYEYWPPLEPTRQLYKIQSDSGTQLYVKGTNIKKIS